MNICYVICAAGVGSRTKDFLPNLPKPLIKLNGKTLLERSIESLILDPSDSIVIISQLSDNIKAQAGHKITQQLVDIPVHFIEINGQTAGQLDTALLASDHIKKFDSVVVFNSDTYFKHNDLYQLQKTKSYDGIIPCSKEPGDAWSFCLSDKSGIVSRVTEKERISELASVGYYYFKNSESFLLESKAYLESITTDGERYVAPFYNYLLSKGHKVLSPIVDAFKPMGSLEQLESYWGETRQSLIAANNKRVLVVDLDNTITIEDSNTAYPDKKPNLALIKKLQDYSKDGFTIYIYTARRMRTHQDNVGKVVADIGQITHEWLRKNNVPCDGLFFGKPYAENSFYVDDKAIRPDEFLKYNYEELMKLIGE